MSNQALVYQIFQELENSQSKYFKIIQTLTKIYKTFFLNLKSPQ